MDWNEQLDLRIHDVAHAQHGERRPPRLAGRGIDGCRACGTVAAAKIVRADDAKLPRVERLARTDEAVPPAFVRLIRPTTIEAGHACVDARRVLAAGHRVEEEDDVRLVGVHAAIGFVGERELRQCAADAKLQWLLRVVELEELCFYFSDVAGFLHWLNLSRVLPDGLASGDIKSCGTKPPQNFLGNGNIQHSTFNSER